MSSWIARTYRGRRLDRNPLRRASDRAETLIGICLLALFAVLAPLVAHVATAQTEQMARAARAATLATSRQVTATTLRTAPAASQSPYSYSLSAASARWTAPDGAARTGQIQVAAGTPRGSREQIWVAPSGALVPSPPSAWQVAEDGRLAAILSVTLLVSIFVIIVALIRLAFRRYRSATLDAEWAAIGPRWNPQHW
jgi:hypothetical protein